MAPLLAVNVVLVGLVLVRSAPTVESPAPVVLSTVAAPTMQPSMAPSSKGGQPERLAQGERKLLLYWSRLLQLGEGGLLGSAHGGSEISSRAEKRRLLEEARALFEQDASLFTYAGSGIYRHRHYIATPSYVASLYAAYCTGELDGQAALQRRLRAQGIPPALYAWWFGDLSRMSRIVGGLWYFRCHAQMQGVQFALRRYARDNDGRYPASLRDLEGTYLTPVPRCPADEQGNSYVDGYRLLSGPEGFELRCANHAALHAEPLQITAQTAPDFTPSLSGTLFTEFCGYNMVAAGFYSPRRIGYAPTMFAPLRLRKGEDVADVGCGVGVYTFPLAQAVGPTGRVYAIDLEPAELEAVDYMAKAQRMSNVVTVKSMPTDITLSADSIDVALMNDVYTCLLRPDHPDDYAQRARPLLVSIHRSLRRGGRFALSEKVGQWGRLDRTRGMLTPELLREQVEAVGFTQVWSSRYGRRSERCLLVFRKK